MPIDLLELLFAYRIKLLILSLKSFLKVHLFLTNPIVRGTPEDYRAWPYQKGGGLARVRLVPHGYEL
jgi:hypothetical protein